MLNATFLLKNLLRIRKIKKSLNQCVTFSYDSFRYITFELQNDSVSAYQDKKNFGLSVFHYTSQVASKPFRSRFRVRTPNNIRSLFS